MGGGGGGGGGGKVLGKIPVLGHPTIWMIVGQWPIALAVGAGGVVWTILLSTIFSPLSHSLWEAARYRLKYCLKGPLNPKQPSNQPTNCFFGIIRIILSQFENRAPLKPVLGGMGSVETLHYCT